MRLFSAEAIKNFRPESMYGHSETISELLESHKSYSECSSRAVQYLTSLKLPSASLSSLIAKLRSQASYRKGSPIQRGAFPRQSGGCHGSSILLADSAGTSRGSGFLCREGLRDWHGVGYCSRQVLHTLQDRLRIPRKCGWQIRDRPVRVFEIKRAG